MDFSVEGAINRASNMFDTTITYDPFESNFYPGWAHTRKCMHLRVDLKGKKNYLSVLESWGV